MDIKNLKKKLLGSTENAEQPKSETSLEINSSMPRLPDDALIIVPMHGTVLFPQVVLPLVMGRKRSIEAVQQAIRLEKPIGLLMQRNDNEDDPSPDDLYKVGAVAEILRYITAPDGTHHLVCQGVQRFKVKKFPARLSIPAGGGLAFSGTRNKLEGD